MKDSRWSEVADLIAVLRNRWNSGRFLKAYAASSVWEPLRLAVHGPTAEDLLERLDSVRDWVSRFERDAGASGRRPRLAIEYRTVRSQHLGANQLPARVIVESFEQLCRLLGTSSQVHSFDGMLAETAEVVPELVPWMRAHPLMVIENTAIWSDLLATVAWIRAHKSRGLYLRQIDVAAIDTKFVERNEVLLSRLLQATMTPETVVDLPRGVNFARRFGYASLPSYTRFRVLDHRTSPFPPPFSEVTLRTDELAEFPLPAGRVFVVENEISYLAFPALSDAIVVFGSGFALTSKLALPWVADREIIYWGDIDTFGFDILDQLRAIFPTATSILMDLDTLLAHRKQWVCEPAPTSRNLECLNPEESALYRDLVEDRYGHHVRLEQERVRFGLVKRALQPWGEAE